MLSEEKGDGGGERVTQDEGKGEAQGRAVGGRRKRRRGGKGGGGEGTGVYVVGRRSLAMESKVGRAQRRDGHPLNHPVFCAR